MARIHFLNVKQGDCSIIEHNSGHTSVIDVCNAKPSETLDSLIGVLEKQEKGISGNFQQKKYPVNPINYMRDRGINKIFRYIQTHPDMDHMDGIKVLFDKFNPINFWDTSNTKEMQVTSWKGSPYSETDWSFYKHLRDTNPKNYPKRLTLYSGARGNFFNQGIYSNGMGDGLYILAPTKELVNSANEAVDDYHSCSYVILYITGGNRIVFSGDSHDATWDYILEHHKDEVTNIDLLIAPHHGRDSSRSYEFLETLTPTLTFFGNARSEHLAYGAWANRGLPIITNNQANCMVVDASTNPMTLYVTYENFARKVNYMTYYNDSNKAWYVGSITDDLIP